MRSIVERIRRMLDVVYGLTKRTRKATEELPGAPPEDGEGASR
jgi:hypothetical protein